MSSILVIDDDAGINRTLQVQLGTLGHEVRTAVTAGQGSDLMAEDPAEILFLDINLPDESGLEVLERFTKQYPQCAIIMITGMQDMNATIGAIRAGAFDYIRKPLDIDDICIAVEKASRLVADQRDGRSSKGSDEGTSGTTAGSKPREIVGSSRAITEVLKKIGLLSRSRVSVLIEGESGTGKELVARALHEATTPGKPFVAVNCSSIVPTLLESELFGHEKGAFTGATSRKSGKLELASDGTVFFDEIGDLSTDLQGKLLRALQEREFERVGDVKSIPLMARVMAATHRRLSELLEEGRFRADLYYRLSVSTISVPPLRERMEDVELLARSLLSRIQSEMGGTANTLSDAAIAKLANHHWPGNVRELENTLARAVATSRTEVIDGDQIEFSEFVDSSLETGGKILSLRDMEKRHVAAALEQTGWNITRTAELLVISPTTLRKKIYDYGLEKPE